MQPDLDAPDYRFVNLLRETYWMMRATIDARLEPMGLSHARWRPLLLLYLSPVPMTQVQLARALSVESPTLVRLLDRLAECGWIVRRVCPDDRRAYHIALTARARRVCADLYRVVTQVRQEALDGVSAEELQAAISVLERVHARFHSLQQPGVSDTAPAAGKTRVRRRARKAID